MNQSKFHDIIVRREGGIRNLRCKLTDLPSDDVIYNGMHSLIVVYCRKG